MKWINLFLPNAKNVDMKFWATLLTIVVVAACKPSKSPAPKGTEQETADKEAYQQQRMDQEFIKTQDPVLGYIPKERLEAAEAQMRSMMASPSFRTNTLNWQERGPINVGGRVRALFIDSRDASGNTIFAGGVGGGIWKCTGFKSATPVWTVIDDNMSNLAVTAMAQDPTNGNIMYAGTGEGYFNSDAILGDGIYKSTDGGISWNRLPSTHSPVTTGNFHYVQDIVVTSAGVVFATTRSRFCNRGGTFRSTDGGVTWNLVLGTQGADCTAGNNPNIRGADLEIASNGDLYATTGFSSSSSDFQGRIWKSSAALNGANVGTAGTWVNITPTPTAGVNFRRIDLTIAPSNTNVLYALCVNGDMNTSSVYNGGNGGLYKSIDGGANWFRLAQPSWCDQGGSVSDFTRQQAWYDLIVQVDPNNPDVVLVGGVDLLKSTNGGIGFFQLTNWAGNTTCAPSYVHADQHNLLFYPGSSQEMISANDGGLYYSTNGGGLWIDKNFNFNVTQFYAAAIHPTQTNYFLAGAQDNGSHKFQNPGLNATTKPRGGDGAFCHIDQQDGQIQIVSVTGNNYSYSRNGGATWSSNITNNNSNIGQFINPTDYDDVSKVLYTSHNANTMGVVTGLSGTTTPVLNAVSVTALGGRSISALCVEPNNGGTVWVAGFSSGIPALIKLTSANTLSPVVSTTATLTGMPNGAYISCIALDPNNTSKILLTLSNYGVTSVWESTNGGTSFTAIEGNLPDMPVRWAMYAPADGVITGSSTGGILLATELGVWGTNLVNGNSTSWVPLNNGLPNTRIDMLQYRSSDKLVAAATHGRGLYTTNIQTTTSINPVNNTKGFIRYASAANGQLLLHTGNLANISSITVQIVDMQGRLVYRNKTAYSTQNINIGKMASGTYVLKVLGNNKETYTTQFVK
jgi:hypothetical protein